MMTASKTKAPYGSWQSPVSAEAIASNSLRLGQVAYDGDDLYFLEGRPSESGRTALVVRHKDGSMEDALPTSFNVRTLVHEYGGGAYHVLAGDIFFVNYRDQLLYVKRPGKEPVAITKESKMRYADMVVDHKRKRIVCVGEDHAKDAKEPENKLVAIDISKIDDLDFEPQEPVNLAQGYDFYSYPRISPDGDFLSYIAWRHPNLPWDGTDLHLAALDESGAVKKDVVVAGGKDESVFQPSWSPDGKLFFVNDRTGWWNLAVMENPRHAIDGTIKFTLVLPMDAEFGMPLWVFGMSTYSFLGDDKIVANYNERGTWRLGIISSAASGKYSMQTVDSPYTQFDYLTSNGKRAVMLAGSPSAQSAVVEFDPASGKFTSIKSSSPNTIDEGYLSIPEGIEFPTEGGLTAYAFYYKPTNKEFEGLPGELPPLLVMSHGGPTGGTSTVLAEDVQYYTSRGFAVVDVNYGGSTGYGREYRNRLLFNWGLVDVNDCANAARYLVKKGLVDEQRLAITGGSAGGYTTLCALTFLDLFQAGASHYGIGDIEALARDTHKFEARYLDNLIGAYPEQKQIYFDRSPINFTERLNCPVIFFQGLDDMVVPPNQAEAMVDSLKKKGLPVAYLPYEGEQHGFRKAENIKRTIEAEFYFYSQIFSFKPADDIEPVHIENLAVGASH